MLRKPSLWPKDKDDKSNSGRYKNLSPLSVSTHFAFTTPLFFFEIVVVVAAAMLVTRLHLDGSDTQFWCLRNPAGLEFTSFRLEIPRFGLRV